MHKEAVNTFNKGLIKDTHPLTTPADVLTDCLNGTVITYNGNELILQNDMGNVLIGSAALPQGYVPVGMTEYGGIIYVASYSPSTGKGLIGSFPSPLQKHGAETWSVNIDYGTPVGIDIDTSTAFYSNANSNDIIRTEIKSYVGLVQGQDNTLVNAYMLHTGDKISFSKLLDNEEKDSSKSGFEELLNSKYLLVQFGILKLDGSIEIVEGDYLLPGEHVYTGRSSGYPIIIIKLLTLVSFNLERQYTRGTQVDTVNVTFTGKAEKEVNNEYINLNNKITVGGNTYEFTTINDSQLNYNSLGITKITGYQEDAIHNLLKFTVNNCTMSGELQYEITPFLHPQGNLVTMKKTGTIDLSKFKRDTKELTNWSYLVLDNYVRLNWSFDYYNLDSVEEFKQINFLFFDLAAINYAAPIYTLEIVKDSFNGSFEEIINFNEEFRKNRIYVVRVTAYNERNEDIHIGNRMLYTSTIFNSYYGKVKDFTNKGFKLDSPSSLWLFSNYADLDTASANNLYTNIPFKKDIKVNIITNVEVSNTTNYANNHISITYPNLQTRSFKTPKGMSINDFTIKTNDKGNGRFSTIVDTNYSFKANIEALIVPDSTVIGTPANETIAALVSSFGGSTLDFTDLSTKIGIYDVDNRFTQELEDYSDNMGLYSADSEYNKGSITYTGLDFLLEILAKSTDVKTTIVNKIGAMPLYYSDMKAGFKDKAFTAWNSTNPRLCSGAGETDIDYNSSITSNGPSAGAGCDDYGLNTAMEKMNLPMVSMFRGKDGDEACYYVLDLNDPSIKSNPATKFRRRNVAGWGNGDGEIDNGDNFLVTVWKQTDNLYRFSPLISHVLHSSKSGRLIRLDYMLRTLLSQIFTKQLHKNTISYVATSSEEFGYYEPNILVEVNLQQDSTNYNNVLYGNLGQTNYDILYGNKTIGDLINGFMGMSEFDSKHNSVALKQEELMTIKYDYIVQSVPSTTSFGKDMGITEISNLMVNSVYKEDEGDINDGTNERYIYVIDWTAIKVALESRGESLDTSFKDNSIFMLEGDCTIKWKEDNMLPYLKLSGTKDGTGLTIDEDVLDINNPNSPSYIKCNLYGSTDSVVELTINGQTKAIVTFGYDTKGTNGGVTVPGYVYGDVLRTWDGKKWPFYYSFQNMFITYCNWQDVTLDSETELYNEIVVSRDAGHIGEKNSIGVWTDNKDEDAPDMCPILANSYNSLYARWTSGFLESASSNI